MLSSLLEATIKISDAEQITEIFLWLLLIVFVLSIWWKYKDQHSGFTNYTPTLLTSIGILGTFTGIIEGLMDFNPAPDELDRSIEFILAGLKTAFITSLSGMFLSILFKAIVVSGMLKKRDSEQVEEGSVGAEDLYQVMKEQVNGIDQIRRAISENDESSLVGQVKLMRSDINDNHKAVNQHLMLMAQAITAVRERAEQQEKTFIEFQDKLWIKLQDFADMMSKSATEQVIEALKHVIEDFNRNLVDQFGDNFKQLNEAVFKLVEWQENYKQQLGEMKEQYDLGVQAITKTEASVASISNEAKVIPDAMGNLKSVMEVNQHQIEELDRHLVAFQEIRDKAVEAVPEIKEQIDQTLQGAKSANEVLAKGMQESAERMSEILIEGSSEFKENVGRANAALIEASQETANNSEKIKDEFNAALTDINNNLRNLVSELDNGGKAINENMRLAGEQLVDETRGIASALEVSIREHMQEHRQKAEQVFSGLEAAIEKALADTGESVQKQMTMIDQNLERELEKILNSMGSALASISGKFTSDYTQYSEQLARIIAASRA